MVKAEDPTQAPKGLTTKSKYPLSAIIFNSTALSFKLLAVDCNYIICEITFTHKIPIYFIQIYLSPYLTIPEFSAALNIISDSIASLPHKRIVICGDWNVSLCTARDTLAPQRFKFYTEKVPSMNVFINHSRLAEIDKFDLTSNSTNSSERVLAKPDRIFCHYDLSSNITLKERFRPVSADHTWSAFMINLENHTQEKWIFTMSTKLCRYVTIMRKLEAVSSSNGFEVVCQDINHFLGAASEMKKIVVSSKIKRNALESKLRHLSEEKSLLLSQEYREKEWGKLKRELGKKSPWVIIKHVLGDKSANYLPLGIEKSTNMVERECNKNKIINLFNQDNIESANKILNSSNSVPSSWYSVLSASFDDIVKSPTAGSPFGAKKRTILEKREEAYRIVLKLSEIIIKTGYFPTSINISWFKLIPKSDSNKWRVISLQNCISSIIQKAFCFYIESALTLSPAVDEQLGFSDGKSIDMMTYAIIQYMKKGPFLAIDSDISGAFDNFSQEKCDEVLMESIHPSIAKVIGSFLRTHYCATIVDDRVKYFKPRRGVPQGSVLGPSIWKLIADSFLRDIRIWTSFQIIFADDLFFFLNPHMRGKEIDVVLSKIMKKLQEYGLELSEEKSRICMSDQKRSNISSILKPCRTVEVLGLQFKANLNASINFNQLPKAADEHIDKIVPATQQLLKESYSAAKTYFWAHIEHVILFHLPAISINSDHDECLKYINLIYCRATKRVFVGAKLMNVTCSMLSNDWNRSLKCFENFLIRIHKSHQMYKNHPLLSVDLVDVSDRMRNSSDLPYVYSIFKTKAQCDLIITIHSSKKPRQAHSLVVIDEKGKRSLRKYRHDRYTAPYDGSRLTLLALSVEFNGTNMRIMTAQKSLVTRLMKNRCSLFQKFVGEIELVHISSEKIRDEIERAKEEDLDFCTIDLSHITTNWSMRAMAKNTVKDTLESIWREDKIEQVLPFESVNIILRGLETRVIKIGDAVHIFNVLGGLYKKITSTGFISVCPCMSESMEHLICWCEYLKDTKSKYNLPNLNLPLILDEETLLETCRLFREIANMLKEFRYS